ncbi:site-specific DNA-methyltransferase [Actinomadura sp. KC216]|uniref:DNA-methyltransferase n=1 Tax=Actinomadura sp. KC216 TaxID=2530370 RepID=UPI00104BB84D|nr:site-specific DNA-methyltransferase [Actinomadura sp. KC216]TDB85604.1 site-specific DNA-methyltransferase [Actinomadura sp. KC216]
MRAPYWHDKTHALYSGDPRQVLAEMPAESADCIITSPPPWTPPLRDSAADARTTYGGEPTAALYLAALRRLFAQAHRVLTEEGTAWLITGDRYAGQTGWDGPPAGRHRRQIRDHVMTGVPASSLIGLPWRLAFALQDDGWIIRNAIVWQQPTLGRSAVPDRFTLSYELIFLLVKSDRYYFDRDTLRRRLDGLIAETGCDRNPVAEHDREGSARHCGWQHNRRHAGLGGSGRSGRGSGTCRNRDLAAPEPPKRQDAEALPPDPVGDIWSLPPRPQRHTLPLMVPITCITAGCRPGGTVLDMFAADATTGIAARQLGRSFTGVEQTPDLCRAAERRLRESSGHGEGDTR